MAGVFPGRLISRPAIIWLVLVVVHGYFASTSQAGCAGSSLPHSGSAISIYDLEALHLAVPYTLSTPTEPRAPEGRGRCFGGACSQSPTQPPISTESLVTEMHQWGDLPGEWLGTPGCSRLFTPEDFVCRIARLQTPIERPPRASVARSIAC
jgi:hypothetical protein